VRSTGAHWGVITLAGMMTVTGFVSIGFAGFTNEPHKPDKPTGPSRPRRRYPFRD
jgi:hypothetical protein